MTQVTQKLSEEPIIITTYAEPYDPENDVREANAEVAQILDETTGLIYYINDIREVKFNFPQLIRTMATAFRDRSSLPPDRIYGVAVGIGDMIKLFVDAAKQSQYGNINVELCETTEEALEFARSQIASSQEE